MSILQDLPFSLCQTGPDQVDGVGNYYLQILASHESDESPVLDIYLLDSHEQISSDAHDPDYDPIKQSQRLVQGNVSHVAKQSQKQQLS